MSRTLNPAGQTICVFIAVSRVPALNRRFVPPNRTVRRVCAPGKERQLHTDSNNQIQWSQRPLA